MASDHTNCSYESQIQNHSRKIAELETRADYKDKRIDEFSENMKEIKKSIDSLEKAITEFILKSVNDDNELKDLVNKQNNRITALETTNKILKWVITIGFTALTTVVTFLGFLITHLH